MIPDDNKAEDFLMKFKKSDNKTILQKNHYQVILNNGNFGN